VIITDLPAEVARTIHEHNLFSHGDTVIVALSGGADSCALLDILAGLSSLSLRLVVAHLNHCLRGADSDDDEAFARALAEKYSLPFESRRLDVRDMARQQGLNLEDAGRRARITFLEELRTRCKASAIALAHHADDQAETVLMRLLRGSGMTGLCGMSYRNGRGFIRPLLDIRRSEIEAYLSACGLCHREDASNRDTTFLRNRIRLELLPFLAQYNPAISRRLTETATLLADENDLLDRLAEELASRVCMCEEHSVTCTLSLLEDQPRALIRRVFRWTLLHLTGSVNHFSRRHIAALEQLAASPCPNASIDLPGGITARREYGRMLLQRKSGEDQLHTVDLYITGPGHFTLPGGDSLSVFLNAAAAETADTNPARVRFDLEKAPFPWHLRFFRAGDRFVPLGMTGTKKVKNLFIDLKVPLSARRRIPLVFSGDTLIWVCGRRMSQHARTDSESTRVVTAVYTETAAGGTRQLSCQQAYNVIDI
jgi:tRNA(Ile)-lysidine synthase